MVGRTDFLLDLFRTRNGAAIAVLVALVIVGGVLGNRRSTWIVALLGLLAVMLGYAFSGPIAASSDWLGLRNPLLAAQLGVGLEDIGPRQILELIPAAVFVAQCRRDGVNEHVTRLSAGPGFGD